MKLRRLPPSPHLKKRYNLVHRLRLQGVSVDTVGNAINISTAEQYEALPALARKYIRELREEYRYVIQTYIPAGESGNVPLKFRRKLSS